MEEEVVQGHWEVKKLWKSFKVDAVDLPWVEVNQDYLDLSVKPGDPILYEAQLTLCKEHPGKCIYRTHSFFVRWVEEEAE